MTAALSLQQSPPFSVPARFFITAPLFGISAAILLMVYGADVLSSRWNPAFLAITHCLVLGFFATVMIGALQQMLPVLAGVMIQQPIQVATGIHILWVPGVALLVYSFLTSDTVFFLPAAGLLASAIIFFAIRTIPALMQSGDANESGRGIVYAVSSLLVTLLIGITLVLGYLQVLPLWRPIMTNLHAAWGLAGWMGVLIMTVAWQVVPMFQITPAYPLLLRRVALPLILSLLVARSLLLFVNHHAMTGIGLSMIDLFIVTGLAIFAVITLRLQQQGRRKVRDVHRDFWRLGMCMLILAALLWLAGILLGNEFFVMLATVVYLLGFAMAIVTGMLIKIVSFLIWLHLQSLRDQLPADAKRQVQVPRMASIIPARQGIHLFWSLLAAQLFMPAAFFFPIWLTTWAALLWLGFFMLLTWVLARAMFAYHKDAIELTRKSS